MLESDKEQPIVHSEPDLEPEKEPISFYSKNREPYQITPFKRPN